MKKVLCLMIILCASLLVLAEETMTTDSSHEAKFTIDYSNEPYATMGDEEFLVISFPYETMETSIDDNIADLKEGDRLNFIIKDIQIEEGRVILRLNLKKE